MLLMMQVWSESTKWVCRYTADKAQFYNTSHVVTFENRVKVIKI